MVIELLNNCGWKDNAMWFSEYKNAIEITDQSSKQFNKLLDELDNVLYGMGSFSDLPLRDKTGKKSEKEIRNLQWELVQQLGDVIEKLREN